MLMLMILSINKMEKKFYGTFEISKKIEISWGQRK
jgi:hypothetical protein